MIRRIMMKKYKVRIIAYQHELNAVLPFDYEPNQQQLESKIIEYLNNNLFKVEYNSFVALESFNSSKKEKKYNENIYYWEIKD